MASLLLSAILVYIILVLVNRKIYEFFREPIFTRDMHTWILGIVAVIIFFNLL